MAVSFEVTRLVLLVYFGLLEVIRPLSIMAIFTVGTTLDHHLCTFVQTLWSVVMANHLALSQVRPSLVLLPAYFVVFPVTLQFLKDSSWQLFYCPLQNRAVFLRYHARSSLVLLVAYFMISRDNLAALQVLPSLVLLFGHFMVSPAAMPLPYCVSRQPADGNTIQ